MASSSPPSSGRGRRLSELLEEQQEPFFLDIYLIENGYSTKLLEAQSTTICWPSISSTTNKLQRLTSNGFKKRRGSSWLVRTILSKILHAKAVKRALNWDYKPPEIGRKSVSDCLFKSKRQIAHARLSCSDRVDADEFDGKEVRWESIEMEDSNSKQLSPVSVFELHSYESSPLHDGHCKEETMPNKALDIFKELLEAAYTPALNQFAESKELENSKVVVEDVHVTVEGSDHECLGPGGIEEYFKKEELELAMIRHLIQCEVSQWDMEWRDFLKAQERESIGIEIEGAIFEEMRGEAVFDILGLLQCKLERC
ncbi:uncharacterized protein LOC109718745 isoform X2 [Ananas comosus]|uniref:Uncharacterized protein LOC109718745 isoform X2 n=1 Tax=Ananas comosus TaxID=4615 RepID=A0A6P5FXI7_ANACO|nr:uncharacterized protein LOC109718745 isoform X2 [Ananas comosus]